MKKFILFLLLGLLTSCGITFPDYDTYYVKERPVVIHTTPSIYIHHGPDLIPPRSPWIHRSYPIRPVPDLRSRPIR